MGFDVNDRVRWTTTGQYGTITGNTQPIGNITFWEVDFDGTFHKVSESQLVLVPSVVSPLDSFKNRDFDDFSKLRQYLTHIRITGELTNIVYSMKYGDVEFLPYQFKPVFKFISSNNGRLLIADEVGLGKTIESLYIWKEIQAREGASRLLIVAPAMLRYKWQNDMQQHFGINSEIVDARRLLNDCKRAKTDNDFGFAYITSIQGIRSSITKKDAKRKAATNSSDDLNLYFEELIDEDATPLFDMIIIDEAHYLVNSGTANFKTANKLNSLTRNLLLLSATPVNNSETDLYSLLRLLSPAEYDSEKRFKKLFEENRNLVKLAHCFYSKPANSADVEKEALGYIKNLKETKYLSNSKLYEIIEENPRRYFDDDLERKKKYNQISDLYFYSNVFSRSRKRDVMQTATRSAQTVYFKLSYEERKIYNTCSRELMRLSKQRNADRIYIISIMMRQRELASCIPAALRRWKEKSIIGNHNTGNLNICTDIDYEFEDNDDFSDLDSNVTININDITDADIDQIEANDSKYQRFFEALSEKINEARNNNGTAKIVVFSFFRNTLSYLKKRLEKDGINAEFIIGGMKPDDKEKALRNFRENPRINVLLSSEVGAEGLDLQFSSIEVNYDLPWNPMKLEQRIGRIDRIGQSAEKIIIINMSCENTVEDRILERLYDKIAIFKESIGELNEILGKLTRGIEYTLLSPDLTDVQKEQEALNKADRYVNEIIQLRQLEESAGLTRAYSDSIIEYVNNAEHNNRYIRKEDIISYMHDYFTMLGHGTRFDQDAKNPDVWNLEFSSADKDDFYTYGNATNTALPNIKSTKITCTFPQGRKSSSGYNIDVNHPIMKWIKHRTEEYLQSHKPKCSYCARIASTKLESQYEAGLYAFYIRQFDCDGLRKVHELLYYVCDVNSGKVLDQQASEYIISTLLFEGEREVSLASHLASASSNSIDVAIDKCVGEANNKISEIYDDLSIENDTAYNRMLAKTNAFYEDKLRVLEKQLDEYQQRNNQNLIRLTAARIDKARGRYDQDIQRIENNKMLQPSYDDIALGVLYIY